MKVRIIAILGVMAIAFGGWTPRAQAAVQPKLSAQAAVLMDFTTGEILYQKNPRLRKAPASTTKILTAVVALERGKLNQEIVVTPAASGAEGSSIYLARGEKHTLEDMLYGILLSSGNDAAIAVAENLAGSEAEFARWMTEKAREIGATTSVFKNSSGLPQAGHYSTAGDLALITRYALNNPIFSTMVGTKQKRMAWPDHDDDRRITNHNKLLWRYEYADGVKTGYTREAGPCLVASATRNGHRLIAVVLNSRRMYEDTKALFDYGFHNYQLITFFSPLEQVAQVTVNAGVQPQVSVLPGRPLTLLLPRGAESDLRVNLELPNDLQAPLERLQPVGELQVQLGDRLIEKVPVVTAVEVPKKNLWQRMWDWVKGLFRKG